MKKIILTILACGIVVLGITGCGKTNKPNTNTIIVNLNDTTNVGELKVGKILTYSLSGIEYEFKITDINENKISIEVNKFGLTNTSSLLSEDNKFIIEKGKKLKLHTQSMDYQESIIFEY